VVIKNST